jgi:LPXTG-motif cell wall-anchored protein
MKAANNRTVYIIVIAIIIVAFILFGGGHWMNGMMHESMSTGMSNWNWTQILISIGIGFALGWFIAKRRK